MPTERRVVGCSVVSFVEYCMTSSEQTSLGADIDGPTSTGTRGFEADWVLWKSLLWVYEDLGVERVEEFRGLDAPVHRCSGVGGVLPPRHPGTLRACYMPRSPEGLYGQEKKAAAPGVLSW